MALPVIQVLAGALLMMVMMVVANPAKESTITEKQAPLPVLQKVALSGIFAL
jgi:hypothetical protein